MDGRYDRHQLRDRWHGRGLRHAGGNVIKGRWLKEEDERLKQVRVLSEREEDDRAPPRFTSAFLVTHL